MDKGILFVGPISDQGGPAIKNRVMVNRLGQTAAVKTYNTYRQSAGVRIGAVLTLLFTRRKYVIVAVSRKGRRLLYPLLPVKQKISGIHYCCVIIGANDRTNAPVRALRGADLVTLETQRMAQDVRTAYQLTNVLWLPNYKESERGERTSPDPDRFHGRKIRFLFLSSMRNSKGVKTLLDAFQRAAAGEENAELDFYGPIREDLDPSVPEEIERAERVRYCGKAENSQVLRTMEDYHVFIFPSEYSGEGFPAVLVEAMTAGLPVIASDINDNPEIIREGRNGWIFPRGDSEQLADRIRYCMNHREELDRISANNRADAAQFDADRVLNGFRAELKKKGWPV